MFESAEGPSNLKNAEKEEGEIDSASSSAESSDIDEFVDDEDFVASDSSEFDGEIGSEEEFDANRASTSSGKPKKRKTNRGKSGRDTVRTVRDDGNEENYAQRIRLDFSLLFLNDIKLN